MADVIAGNTDTDVDTDIDNEGEVEVEINPAEVYTPSNAPYPNKAIIATLKAWLGVVIMAEDLPDDLKDEIKNIPEFHFAAFATKVQTELMRAGVYEDKDGRLTENKKKGVKLK